MRTKTAMLESRFLAGDAELAGEFRRQFRSKCVNGYEREYVELRMRDQVARHKKFGDSVYLQEPNLKSGCGGLRDYQNLLWMIYFKEGSLSTNQLVGKDWLSESDQRRIEKAYDFLLRLRTALHYATERATDILHINLQEQIAKQLDYSSGNGQLRSEALMRDYYEHTRNIFRVTERITEQFVSVYVTSKTRSLFRFLRLSRSSSSGLRSRPRSCAISKARIICSGPLRKRSRRAGCNCLLRTTKKSPTGVLSVRMSGRKLKRERVLLVTYPLTNCSVMRSVTRKMFRVCS